MKFSKKLNLKFEYFVIIKIILFSFGLLLFLNGYFPLTQNVSNEIRHHSNVKPQVHRMVLIVIDALRDDLVNSNDMPFLTETILKNDKSCRYTAKVEAPTVTMPRIKALTTGVIPNFIDIVLNFGSKELKTDNLLQVAHESGQKIIFFGDNTWIKLFPKIFYRSDGTTSFFVNDYTEVDNNVTRHLDKELSLKDWDIMILHYLGLDHIGHIQGPKSPFIPPKLHEMDSVIKKIYQSLKTWESKTEQKSLLIVTGDHGMKDSGGHGGSSHAEVNVPLIISGIECLSDSSHKIAQTDVTPTLSVLLGLPFPKSSIGRLIEGFLISLSHSELLIAFKSYYNHLLGLLETSSFSKLYEESTERLKKILYSNHNSTNNNEFRRLFVFYKTEIEFLSNHLLESRIVFDTYTLWIALTILLSTTVLFVQNCGNERSNCTLEFHWVILLIILTLNGANFGFCYKNYYSSDLCDVNRWPLVFFISLCIGFNVYNIVVRIRKKLKLSRDAFLIGLVLAHIFQTLSLTSSSFVEEEPHVWFYYNSTVLFLIFYNLIFFNLSNVNKKNVNYHTLMIWTLLLILYRVARDLNVTYVDYEPHNIQLWLNESSNIVYLTIFFIIGLIFTCISCLTVFKPGISVALLMILNFVSIFLYRGATNVVLSPIHISNSEILLAKICFWCTFLLAILHLHASSRRTGRFICLRTFLLFWIMLCSLLLRPHNVTLIPILMLGSTQICQCLENDFSKAIIHYWLGKSFYFYQGITNNIATIDITSGYVGQTSYNEIIVGLLIFVHTYTMPVISYLMLLINTTKRHASPNKLRHASNKIYSAYLAITFCSVSYYCIVMLIHRSHLFIWSVFSPKLMFDAVYALVVILCVIFTEIFVMAPLVCVKYKI